MGATPDVEVKDREDAVEVPAEEIDQAPEIPTEEAAAAAVAELSPEEQAMVRKHGLVQHEETAEEKTARETKEAADKAAKAAGKPPAPAAKPAAKPDKPAETPEADIEALVNKDLTAAEEYDKTKKFSKSEFALYREMKKNRADRQTAQRERDAEKSRAERLEKILLAIKENPAAPGETTGDPELDALLQEFDAEGNPVAKKPAAADPAKPITQADLDKRDADKAAAAEKERKAAEYVDATLKDLETVERQKEPLFDVITDMANEVILADKSKTYRDRFVVAIKQTVFDRAKISDEETCFGVAYSLAKLHPEYAKRRAEAEAKIKAGDKAPAAGAKPAGSAAEKEKADKDLAARVARNAERKSSAGVAGGGGNLVSYDDLTLKDAIKVWRKLPAAVRERLLKQSSEQSE